MEQPAKIGKYEILERVGRGGMGVLYRGRDPVLDREVAIKVMLADFAEDESARPRFYREARAIARLQHRNIVTVFEFGEEEQNPYIVMEFLRGQDLSRRMRGDPPMTLEQKLDVVAELCSGLHYAHQQGVIHRDVKPGNIWLLPDGSVKLLDFGIAKLESSSITRAGSMFGTAGYMAPEQVLGETSDGRADIFSAGVVLYELLSGRKPFDAATPTAVLARIIQDAPDPIDRFVSGLPPALVGAIGRALERELDRRYQLAGDFAAELRMIRAALPPGQEPVVVGEPPTIATPASSGLPLRRSDSAPPPPGTPMPAARPDLAALWRQALRPPMVYATGGVGVLLLALVVFLSVGGKPAPKAIPPAQKPPALATNAAPVEPSKANPVAKTADIVNAANEKTPAKTPDSSAPAVATIHGSYPFEVNDGAAWSQPATDHEVKIKGRRTVRIRSEEYLLNESIEFDASRPRTLTYLVADPGTLTFRWAPESCQAFIGNTELPFGVTEKPIAAGRYVVRLVCPDTAGNRSKQITIRPGQPTREDLLK